MRIHLKSVTHLISCLDESPVELEWLIDTTEKWCRDRAIYLALLDSIAIADGKDDKKEGMLFLVFSLTLWLFLSIII